MGRSLAGLITLLRKPLIIFLVAITLRTVLSGLLLAHTTNPWGVNEAANIAQQLVHGHGFASPFHDTNAPTAWLAPVYPCLLAALFLIFGVKTLSAAAAAVFLNVLFGSLTTLCLLQLARDHFSESAGLVAAWAWAISPPVVVMPFYLWETCFSALVLSFAFLRTLRLKESSTTCEWIVCGCVWAFAALLNPALLAPLPALVVLRIWRKRDWKRGCILLTACILCIAPWTIRNVLVLHHVVPIRSNFWPELYFGNVTFDLHPTGDSMVYQREGEMAFNADLRSRVLEYIHKEPGQFCHKTAHRVVAFWIMPAQFRPLPAVLILMAIAGVLLALAERRDWPGFASVLFFYPLIYYISYTFARYRHPIEPIMYVLSAFTITDLFRRGRARFRGGI